MRVIDFDGDICQNPALAFEKEWVLTNSLGGFASTTIIGANTSKYHGLLVASLNPPLERVVFLSKVEEEIIYNKKTYMLSTNLYPNTVFPTGYNHIVNFRMDPFPITTYLINDVVEIEKMIFFVHDSNKVVLKYRLNNAENPVTLKISPLIAFRDIHSNTYKNNDLIPDVLVEENSATIKPYETLPPLYFYFNSKEIRKTGFWYNTAVYPKEIEKNLPGTEDLFNPFEVLFTLNPDDDAFFIASLDKADIVDPDDLLMREMARYQKVSQQCPQPNSDAGISSILKNAADSFIVKKNSRKTIVAGYPWLSERTCDSMIALDGLCLETGRFEDAREILLKAIEQYRKGLLPEYFSEKSKEPNYTSIYPSLFFISAVYAYYIASKDIEIIQNPMFYVIQAIISSFSSKAEFNISEEENGLLCWEDPGSFIVWGTKSVYSRQGFNVEINSHWYNCLKIMAFFSKELGMAETADSYEKKAAKTKKSFNDIFRIPGKPYLYDTVYKDNKNDKITPYQIFSASLPFPVLDESGWADLFRTITDNLLTPYGLRTLPESDPNFRPHYEGNLDERSVSYYSGSVWAWLLGPYIDLMLRVNKNDFTARQKGLKLLKPIFEHFSEAGLCTISEIFDGIPKHKPGGCISQAVAVAEVLRAYNKLCRL